MLYTEKEKHEIERVKEVFAEHLRQSPDFELLWSDKVGYYIMGGYVRQRQHGVKENDRELPDPACGGVSGLSATYRLQH